MFIIIVIVPLQRSYLDEEVTKVAECDSVPSATNLNSSLASGSPSQGVYKLSNRYNKLHIAYWQCQFTKFL